MARAWPIEGLTPRLKRPEAAARTVLTRAAEVAVALPGGRERKDPEQLHDLRVALRRLRAAMSGYAKIFPASLWEPLSDQVAGLFRSTTAMRDLDVQLEHLGLLAGECPDAAVAGIAWLAGEIRKARGPEEASVDDALDAFERGDVLARLAAVVAAVTHVEPAELHLDTHLAPPGAVAEVTTGDGHKRVRGMARTRLGKRTSEFTARFDGLLAAGELLAEADPVALHELRKDAKKLRYTVELFGPALPRPDALAALADEIGDLQDVLGEIHDTDILAGEMRKRLGPDMPGGPVVAGLCYVMADTLARNRASHADLRREWPAARLQDVATRCLDAA